MQRSHELNFGDLKLHDGRSEDPSGVGCVDMGTSSLQYLAHVDTSRIPLHLVVSAPLLVDARISPVSHQWLSEQISQAAATDGSVSSQELSSVGILLKVWPTFRTEQSWSTAEPPMITEIVFYLDVSSIFAAGEHRNCRLCATMLSSELWHNGLNLTGSVPEPVTEAHNLPTPPDIVSDVPLQDSQAAFGKKHDLNNLFDSASAKRRKARQKGGQGISLAASRVNSQSPGFDIKREEVDLTGLGDVPPTVNVLQGRHRRPEPQASLPVPKSITTKPPSRPSSRNGPDRKRSSLSQMQTPDDTSFDTRNRQTVSKTVMAGMRIYGLQQRKSEPQQHIESQIEGDDEYKNVYHQTFKGTMFAFRRDLEIELLRPNAVREVVDRLLAVFCGDAA